MSEYHIHWANTQEDAGAMPPLPPAGEKDCQGVELKVGDKVAWSIGGRSNSGLSFGVVTEVATPSWNLIEWSIHHHDTDILEGDPDYDPRYDPKYTYRNKQYYYVKEWRWQLSWTRTSVKATRKGRKGVDRRGDELIHYVEGPDNGQAD